MVTIAVLDTNSRKMIPSRNLLALAAFLGDSLSGNTTIPNGMTPAYIQSNPQFTAQVWQNQLLQSGLAQSRWYSPESAAAGASL